MHQTSRSFLRRIGGWAIRRLLLAGALRVALAILSAALGAQHSFPFTDDDGAGVSRELPAPGAMPRGNMQGVSRITHGEPVAKSEWRSIAFVQLRSASGGTASCGGTIIADRWVLTAGHCVVGRSAADFTVTEDADELSGGGHAIGVDRVVIHDRYAGNPPRNDIALLHLAAPARSPRQALIAGDAAQTMLRPGTPAAVAGFGLTTPQSFASAHIGRPSSHLMQTRLAVVERNDCARILADIYGLPASGVTFIGESTVCAADAGNAGRDACFGDSGGPLTLDLDRSRVQVGVVSWGPGCGLRDTVGVYTSVGYFEDWIRTYAPDVIFVAAPRAESPPPPAVAFAQPGPPPLDVCGLPAVRSSRVNVAIAEGDRLRIGAALHVSVTPGVTGQLLVFNVDTRTCRIRQIYPNQYSGSSAVVPAGATVSIPAGGGFVVRASAPAGPNRIYAVVIPRDALIRDIVARGLDMRTGSDAPSLWGELSARIRQGGRASAVGVFAYEIVP